MMRPPFALSLLFALAACGASPTPPPTPAPPRTPTPRATPTPSHPATPIPTADRDFIRRLALTKNFTLGQPVGATPTPDGKSVLFLRSGPRDRRQALLELDVASGVARELLSPSTLDPEPETLSPEEHARRERMRVTASGFTSFELSKDGARVLVSLSGRLFVLTRATGTVKELAVAQAGGGGAVDPHFSPDGARVAYVRNDDVYTVASDGARGETAVTRGGTRARTHGLAEFIAEEELDRHRGFWWSPDGTKILYEEADTSKVEEVTQLDVAHPERAPARVPYPRAGTPNAEVRFGLVPAGGGATTWIALDAAKFPYVATVRWDDRGPLTMYALDRAQKNGLLVAVDAGGKTKPLLTEHDDAWLEVDQSVPRFLPNGSFLWSSERSGAWALEVRAADGAPARQLDVSYRGLLDVDDAKGTVTFATGFDPARDPAEKQGDPTRSAVARAAGGKIDVIASVPDGNVAASFGRGQHDLFVVRESPLGARPKTYARSVDGKTNVELPSLAEDPGMVPMPEMTRVGPDDVRVAIVRPRAFDPSRTYPVIDAAYAGPGHAVVVASSMAYIREQWLADATGAIVVAIDAMGTPHRGRAWSRALEGKLGAVPLDGHVAALTELARKHPEMDAARIGVYGWSFGGYFSALAALARPDVFRAAVAGAPVVDWRDYDTAYTERYLGTPDADKAAYDAASLLTYAAPKPGARIRPLLVIHGTADDNVYFTNTLKLVDAFERAQRPFELMPLVGVTHAPYEPELAEAMWTRIASFFRANL